MSLSMFKRPRKSSKTPPPPDQTRPVPSPSQPIPRLPPHHTSSHSLPSHDFRQQQSNHQNGPANPSQPSRPGDYPPSLDFPHPPHAGLEVPRLGAGLPPSPGRQFRTPSPGAPAVAGDARSPSNFAQRPSLPNNDQYTQQSASNNRIPHRPATSPVAGGAPPSFQPQPHPQAIPPRGPQRAPSAGNPNVVHRPAQNQFPLSPPPSANEALLRSPEHHSGNTQLSSHPGTPTTGPWRQPTSPMLSPGPSHLPNYSMPLASRSRSSPSLSGHPSPTPSVEGRTPEAFSQHAPSTGSTFHPANISPPASTESHRRPSPPTSRHITDPFQTNAPELLKGAPSYLDSTPRTKRRSRQLSLERPRTPDSSKDQRRLSRQPSLDSGRLRLAYDAARAEDNPEVNQHEGTLAVLGGATSASVALTAFYASNASSIECVSVDLAAESPSASQIESTLGQFSSAASVLCKGLDSLAVYYPAIAIAAQAFKLVLELDIQRRENNKKVGLVRIQLADTMAVLFELRHVKDPEEIGPDGMTAGGRIQSIMTVLAQDIKTIGNGCDAYLAKGVLAKTIKAQKYASRLASFISILSTHKKNLQFALTAHTAKGVDSANEKLNVQASMMKKMEDKLENMLQRMDSPRERDLMNFMEEKGGPARCVNNSTLLEALVNKSGEPMASLSGGRGNTKEEELISVKKFLLKELSESVDDAFNRNMAQFQGKLILAEQRLTDHVTSQADRIIAALQDGAHSRIMDQAIQDIWKDMGWKGSSVKARHFVVALHDFFSERLAKAKKTTESTDKTNSDNENDEWALGYINVAHVQPILESVDDDCTGWITINEVNTFVKDRPAGWSLPYWLAFWAVGWHTSVTRYRNKIYSLIQKMFGLLDHVLPPNKQAVNEYLMNHSMWRLELLLRSTTPASSALASDTELTAMSTKYCKMEEERLERNLESLLYIIESPATIPLICGPGRIERYLYPLVYVLLKRHFKLLLLSCEHVLDEDELDLASGSLLNIITLIDSRVENLEVIFKQTDADVASRLTNYAFGMFKLSYGEIERNPRENSFATWTEFGAFTEEDELSSLQASDIPYDILKYGVKDEVAFQAFEPADVLPTARIRHRVNGLWTGYLYRYSDGDYVSTQGLIQISVGLTPQGRIEGGGESYSGLLSCAGEAEPIENGGLRLNFCLIYPDGFTTRCIGKYNPDNETLSGLWKILDEEEVPPSRQTSVVDVYSEDSVTDQLVFSPPTSRAASPRSHVQMFTFTRTQPWLQRFRPPRREFDENRVGARWEFACSAVLYEVKRSRWWWDFFRTRFAERRKVVDLTTRSLMYLKGFTIAPEDALSDADRAELTHLRQILSPGDARFYSTVADIEIQKLPWHIGYNCDACERELIKWRHICTVCINDTFSDQVDLCVACVHSKVSLRGFSHDESHVLVRTEQVLHDHVFAKTIRDARVITERTKEYFRTLERQARAAAALKQAGTHEAFKRGPTESQMLCACCSKVVTPPMWVCVVCAPDAFICESCVDNQEPTAVDGPAPGHLSNHTIASVRDTTSAVQNSISLDKRMTGLEKKLSNLESSFDARISAMEQSMEERLNSMENLLMQIATSLSSRELRAGFRGHDSSSGGRYNDTRHGGPQSQRMDRF